MSDRSADQRAAAAAERARRRGQPLPPMPVARAEPPLPPPPLAPVPPRPASTRRPASRPPRAPRAGGASYTGRRVLAGLAVLVLALVVWAGVKVFQPFHGEPRGVVKVKVPPGANADAIGDLLAERGVIGSGTFFTLNATVTGRRGGLQPGTYTFQRDMAYGAVLDALDKGPKAAPPLKTFKLTLPEGPSRRELAARIAGAGVEGDYVKAADSVHALRVARGLGLPKGGKTTEGFLFPATYDVVKGATAGNLVDQQLAAFGDTFAEVDLRRAKKKNLTRYDVITIASMVEREAQLDSERAKIAAVIYNRLKAGMPLGIDATIRYAENNWSEPLKVSELERDGPYNSRLNRNLPPTPIGNPGLASLEAAARPANVDFLFYVVKPGTCGEHAFSSTDAEFQRDRARYDAEREAAGGKSPTTC